jgi:DNA-binding transcriptional LysR family regulator
VTLTEAGRVFQPYAARVVATVQDGRQAVAELDGLARGSLLVGASTTPGIYVLPGVVAAFLRRYPGVEVAFRVANSRVIEEQVRANVLDLGVVGAHGLGPGERCLAAGILDELVLIVPARHPWTRQREVAPARIGEARVLVREEGSATRQVTERALQRAGVALKATMELAHTEAIKQAVIAGLGVAFVSRYAVRGDRTGLTVVPVRGVKIWRHFHVIQSEARTLGASAQAFIALLDEEARAMAAPSPSSSRRRA